MTSLAFRCAIRRGASRTIGHAAAQLPAPALAGSRTLKNGRIGGRFQCLQPRPDQ
jgi:hypothetical protein